MEDGGFLVNGDLMVVAEVVGTSDIFEESFPQRKLDVNGFHVVPSQVIKILQDKSSMYSVLQELV